MLASEIISLPVISIYSGKQIGTVENTLFNTKTKKCSYLLVFNETEDLTYTLPTTKIFKLGKDCLFIKNESVLNLFDSIELELKDFTNPISTKLYSLDCNFIGTITDVELNNNYEAINFYVSNKIINQNQILTFGSTTSIYSNKTIRLSNFKHKPKIKVVNTNAIVSTETKEYIELKKPQKVVTDYSFLIDRTATKDIIKPNGEIIIKSGAKITPIIINKARNNGKFIELTHFSK